MANEVITVLASLKAFGATVAGIATGHSFGISDMPEKFVPEQLPAFIIVPEIGVDQGYATSSFTGKAPTLKLEVAHLLFYKSSANLTSAKILPGLLGMIDAYNAAAKLAPYLVYESTFNYNLVMSYAIGFEQGLYANTTYHVIRFQHKMSMNL